VAAASFAGRSRAESVAGDLRALRIETGGDGRELRQIERISRTWVRTGSRGPGWRPGWLDGIVKRERRTTPSRPDQDADAVFRGVPDAHPEGIQGPAGHEEARIAFLRSARLMCTGQGRSAGPSR